MIIEMEDQQQYDSLTLLATLSQIRSVCSNGECWEDICEEVDHLAKICLSTHTIFYPFPDPVLIEMWRENIFPR